MNVLFRLLDRLGRFSQRNARRQVERERDHRELSLVIHRQRGVSKSESG